MKTETKEISPVFYKMVEVKLHNKATYQLLTPAGMHLCYIRDRGEARAVVAHLNTNADQ